MRFKQFLASPLLTGLLLLISSLVMVFLQILYGSGYFFIFYIIGVVAALISFLFIKKTIKIKSLIFYGEYRQHSLGMCIQFFSILPIIILTPYHGKWLSVMGYGIFLLLLITLVFTGLIFSSQCDTSSQKESFWSIRK